MTVQFLRHNAYINDAALDFLHAIEHATPLFSAIASPLYRQIDPNELGQASMYLSEIEEYAKRVMGRWGYSDMREDEIYEIVRRLVWEYPSHDFVIDLQEASDIRLHAELLDDESNEICLNILEQGGFPIWFNTLNTNDAQTDESDQSIHLYDDNTTIEEDCRHNDEG